MSARKRRSKKGSQKGSEAGEKAKSAGGEAQLELSSADPTTSPEKNDSSKAPPPDRAVQVPPAPSPDLGQAEDDSIEAPASAKNRASGGKIRACALLVDLHQVDGLNVEALAFGVCADERPLRNTAGYCDWRLNGRLSGLLLDGIFSAELEETLLTDTNGRIGPARILLFGLGMRAKLDLPTARLALRHMLVTAKKARFQSLGLELPGLHDHKNPPELVKTALDVAGKAHPKAQLVFLCGSSELVDTVDKALKKDERVELIDPPG